MRLELWDYPPYPYLHQVLSHCHKAGVTYLDLWKERDKNNKVTIEKDEIRSRFLASTHNFHHNLLLLVKEGLLSIDESSNRLIVELTDWDVDDLDEDE